MPFTVYGIGTDLIGERDYAPDGSYLTTEWFIVLWLPIFPLRSLRIIPAGADPRWPIFRQSYRLLAESSPSLRQVISVYAFFISYSVWLACWWQTVDLLGKLASLEYMAPVVFLVAALAVLLSPFVVPWYLRRRARSRAGL